MYIFLYQYGIANTFHILAPVGKVCSKIAQTEQEDCPGYAQYICLQVPRIQPLLLLSHNLHASLLDFVRMPL